VAASKLRPALAALPAPLVLLDRVDKDVLFVTYHVYVCDLFDVLASRQQLSVATLSIISVACVIVFVIILVLISVFIVRKRSYILHILCYLDAKLTASKYQRLLNILKIDQTHVS